VPSTYLFKGRVREGFKKQQIDLLRQPLFVSGSFRASFKAEFLLLNNLFLRYFVTMKTSKYVIKSSIILYFYLLMKEIAAIILENDNGEFLLYLRDNKPDIPFPNHWDLIGGHVEEGETPEQALVREVKEELDIDLKDYSFYKKYECLTGDAYENIKYIYSGKINLPIEEVTLLEGVRPQYFSREEIPNVKFANILKSIVMEYISDSN